MQNSNKASSNLGFIEIWIYIKWENLSWKVRLHGTIWGLIIYKD